LRFEHAQHVDKKMRPAQIQNEQNWRKQGRNRRYPHCRANNIKLVKQQRAKGDYRRHSTKAASKKVDWNFPCPHRRPNNWLAIVTRPARDWSSSDIHTEAGNNASLPRIFTQLV
jgi:hypothetical protein